MSYSDNKSNGRKTSTSCNKKARPTVRNKKIPKKITQRYLQNAGLYYLERFAASKAHFKEVMLLKVKRSCKYHKKQNYDDCARIVNEIADKFENCGLLNDNVYAEAIATSMRRKGLSQRAIYIKMNNKGISFGLASKILKKIDVQHHATQENAELAAALRLAYKRKIGPYSNVIKLDVKKSLGILARAGFPYDVAQQVISTTQEEAETILFKTSQQFQNM